MTTPLVQAFESNLITLDQARIRMGLEPDPQFGNRYYFQLFGKIQSNQSYVTKAVEGEQWEKWAEREVKQQNPIMDSFTQTLIDIYDEWRKTMFGEKKVKTPIEKIRDQYRVRLSEMKRRLRETYEDHANRMLGNSVQVGIEALKIIGLTSPDFDPETFKKDIPSMAKYFAEQRIGAFRKQLNDLAKKAEGEGWSPVQFDDGVRTFINQAKTRAKTVSETEIANIATQIKEKVYQANGVTHKVWYAKLTDRTCKYCSHMHGKVIAVGTPFIPKGGSIDVEGSNGKVSSMKIEQGDVVGPPVHPRCRCTLVPALGATPAKPENVDKPAEKPDYIRPELYDDNTKPTQSKQVLKIHEELAKIPGKPTEADVRRIGKMVQKEIDDRIKKDKNLMRARKHYEQSARWRDEKPTDYSIGMARIDLSMYEQGVSQIRKEVLSEIRSMGMTQDIMPETIHFFRVSHPKRDAWLKTLDAIPTEWLLRTLDMKKLRVILMGMEEEVLGLHSSSLNQIKIRLDATPDVFLHEFVHAVSHHFPELFEMEKAYLLKRAGDEPIQPLKKLYPNKTYPDGVEGIKDQLKDPYSGRIYRNKETGEIVSLELLTTAFQAFFEGKNIDIVEDKNLEEFFLGLLTTM